MNPPRKCIVIKALLLALAFATNGIAWAGTTVGTVADLAGALLAKKADGTVRILSQKSVVEQGDTLVTEKDTYARIRFIDNGEITLKPNSQFRIDKFSYEEGKKDADSAAFSLIKGGLRSVTGLLGKRSQDRFGINTPVATIGIRGTTFIAEYVPDESDAAVAAYAMASVAAVGSSYLMPAVARDLATASDIELGTMPLQILPPLAQATSPLPSRPGVTTGLTLQVISGIAVMSNPAGSLNFTQGMTGFTGNKASPPVQTFNAPPIKFAPPPTFNLASDANPVNNPGTAKSGVVDCIVR